MCSASLHTRRLWWPRAQPASLHCSKLYNHLCEAAEISLHRLRHMTNKKHHFHLYQTEHLPLAHSFVMYARHAFLPFNIRQHLVHLELLHNRGAQQAENVVLQICCCKLLARRPTHPMMPSFPPKIATQSHSRLAKAIALALQVKRPFQWQHTSFLNLSLVIRFIASVRLLFLQSKAAFH